MKLRCTFFALFALFLTSSVVAQNRVASKENARSVIMSERATNQNARAVESVFPPSFDDDCSLSVIGYSISDTIWGWVAGMNRFGDLEKAQLLTFEGSATYTVTAVVASFNASSVVNNGELRANIYAYDDGTGLPGDLLATSDSVLAGDIVLSDTLVTFTPFLFEGEDVPTLNSSSFVASIDFSALYASQDTVGLLTTLDSCGSGSNSYERWNDLSWKTMDDAMFSWDLDLDFIITALVEFDESTAADEYVKHKGLELYPATPNPASYFTYLNYGLDKVDQVSIDIFDAQGKRIKSVEKQGQSTGRHQEQILTHDMSPGTYFYRISNSAASLVSRFVVQQ